MPDLASRGGIVVTALEHGATTLSIITLSIKTLSITTFGTTALSLLTTRLQQSV